MKVESLKNMLKGWFIGNFSPSMLDADFEVGVKKYKKGDKEEKHYHKEAIEFTVIVTGIVKMNGVIYKEDDIIQIDKDEVTDFECIEDTITVVVKTSSVKGDKYIV